ncbi:hypothetical protein DERP_004583 [Dermatophagoides pteronyssinus]|uniref:Uncharacterized protein n=1 Tax=Dermatophagoides pteronyssinus TaxID=6956 RepID=A0ABQ8JP69_DERPT|nr:hypothetical protein DERP_004583 [Dermatophagoides pteronyssinus]
MSESSKTGSGRPPTKTLRENRSLGSVLDMGNSLNNDSVSFPIIFQREYNNHTLTLLAESLDDEVLSLPAEFNSYQPLLEFGDASKRDRFNDEP